MSDYYLLSVKILKDTTHMPHKLLVSLHEFHAKKAGLPELNGHDTSSQIHSQMAIYYKHYSWCCRPAP